MNPSISDRRRHRRCADSGIPTGPHTVASRYRPITTAPPMFRITEVLASRRVDVIFEGCDVSLVFGYAHIASGSHDVIAICNGDQFSVRQHEHEIGTLDHRGFLSK